MDELGRVWMTSGVRAPQTLAVCRKGSANKFAQAFPIDYTDRHLSVYDPRTKTFKLIPTCFRTHHVNFGYDKDRTDLRRRRFAERSERRRRLAQHADV